MHLGGLGGASLTQSSPLTVLKCKVLLAKLPAVSVLPAGSFAQAALAGLHSPISSIDMRDWVKVILGASVLHIAAAGSAAQPHSSINPIIKMTQAHQPCAKPIK